MRLAVKFGNPVVGAKKNTVNRSGYLANTVAADDISGIFAAEFGRDDAERRFQRQVVFIHNRAINRGYAAKLELDYIFLIQGAAFFQDHSV